MSKVNQLTVNVPTHHPSKSVPSKKQVELDEDVWKVSAVNVDESLDNLDLFKATNLGRLLQNSNIQEDQKVEPPKSIEKKSQR